MTSSTSPLALNVQTSGPNIGAPLVLLHEFGTDLSLWDALLPLLPDTLRVICLDLRGHGASPCPQPPYSMGGLIKDVESALDQMSVRDAVIMGIGLGGLIAQGLAVKRLDQVRALVLCNSAAKIGHAPHWAAMIDDLKAGGQTALSERFMPLWFHRAAIRGGLQAGTHALFQATNTDGLIGCFQAMSGTDFYTQTAGLRLSCLGIGCTEDRFLPNDMTRETTELVPGSDFKLLRASGHLPPIDAPEALAEALIPFLKRIGHISAD
jgi:3-oxoadipate enol-lactonase